MPFQIQSIAAYRELVLDELRKQALTPGTPTNKIIRDYPGYWPDSGEPKYDWAIWKKIEGAQGCYDSMSEVLWYSYCHAPLHFDALQRMMQMEEEDAADVPLGDTFRKKEFNTDGDLLVVDVGCGPMTAGLALADWHLDACPTPLKLSYIGIDNSDYCAKFAAQFAKRDELFAMQHPPLFHKDCADCDVGEFQARLTSRGTLLFIFSYILGQQTCEQEHMEQWALLIRQVMTACNAKHNLIVYTNSPRAGDADTTVKYAQFRKLLGWRHQPKTDYYQQKLLKRFNEHAGLFIMYEGMKRFRHLLIDAKLVDENRLPI